MTGTAAQEVAQEVLDAADSVLEDASEAVDAARILDVGLLSKGIGIGLIVGAGVTYLALNKILERKYLRIAEDEISQMKNHYNAKAIALKEKPDLDEAVLPHKQDEIIKDERYRSDNHDGPVPYHKVEPSEDKVDEVPKPETANVFEQDEPEVELPDWDQEEENKNRDKARPFIISLDEYSEGVEGHGKTTLTYYEGDDVLADEQDRAIDQQDNIVGLENLQRFGHGSGDPSIVYIRNHHLNMDMEITHSDGKYAMEVHGISDDEEETIQHSSMRRRSPRRSDDDERT